MTRQCNLRQEREAKFDKRLSLSLNKIVNYNKILMECPECKSTHINKNGNKRGKHPRHYMRRLTKAME